MVGCPVFVNAVVFLSGMKELMAGEDFEEYVFLRP